MAIYNFPQVRSVQDFKQKKQAIIAEPASQVSDCATAVVAINTLLKAYLMEATA